MHFVGLLTQCLEDYWSEFHQTPTIGTRMNASVFGSKVKAQGHSMTKAQQAEATRV